MWAQEILLGTTVYLNERRSVHAATAATFDFFSKKKDSDTKVGNILNLEGGLGADFLGGGLTSKRVVYGFVTVRYEWEVAARSSTEGAVWSILATFPLKPIRLP